MAAALTFARRIKKTTTVLIADFGGGTTDFSVLRLAAPDSTAQHEVLGVGGLGIAGDQFDYRIVSNAILPHLGLGTQYKSMGDKVLDLPKHVFNSLARWNELSFLRTTDEYEELKDMLPFASAPEKLKRMFHIVDHSKGLDLYDAVSSLKRQLSSEQDEATFTSKISTVTITRSDFEHWIADDLKRIGNPSPPRHGSTAQMLKSIPSFSPAAHPWSPPCANSLPTVLAQKKSMLEMK